MSHQLRLLRIHGVVTRRKAGWVVYYELADEHMRHVFADALRHSREVSPSLRQRTEHQAR